ncbi:MAG: hypothetical protein ABEJ64_04150 [Candidatus Nanohaloarchaea archaeon]
MRDPWKYVAFPLAAVTGYLVSQTAISAAVGDFAGLSTYLSEVLVVAGAGLVAGFMVDEVIPVYLEKVRSGGGGPGGDLGGDIDSDMDFGE